MNVKKEIYDLLILNNKVSSRILSKITKGYNVDYHEAWAEVDKKLDEIVAYIESLENQRGSITRDVE